MALAEDLVTVVVPTYNRASILVDALDSVFAQLYRPIELIIVDDGSTDDTERVAREWIQRHENSTGFQVRYIHQDNHGGNWARNEGIANATGKYLAFLDSDDRWLPEKLELQMRVFRQDRDVGAVYCGVRHVHLESGKAVAPVKRSYPTGWLLKQMLVHDVTAPTSTYVIRKDVFSEVGCFDVNLRARQDWDMSIRVASRFKLSCVPSELVEYREHAGVRVRSDPERELTAHRLIFGKYADLRARCPFWIRLQAVAAMYRRRARVYFHSGVSHKLAVLMYVMSIIVWPFCFDTYAGLLGMILPRNLRQRVHIAWNRVFGRTPLAIRSH